MTRQSKTYSHIWDNNYFKTTGGAAPRKPYYFSYDTTGSSTVSYLEYSREQCVLVSPHVKCPVEPKQIAENPKKREIYVTDRDREQAPPPRRSAPWVYQPVQREKYNPNSYTDAFEAYRERLRIKKASVSKALVENPKQKALTKVGKRVTIDETVTKIVQDTCNYRPKPLQKLCITNARNDEVKIDNLKMSLEARCNTFGGGIDADVPDDVDEVCAEDVPKDSKVKDKNTGKTVLQGFYGTIEAEQCAERVAAHISLACENLERLQFVAEAVYPQSANHLKKLHEIDNDVKDFNSQMRQRRIKVPNSTGTTTNIAHFIIHDN